MLTLGEARQKACKGGGSTRKESVNGASTGLWLSLTSLQSSTPRAWWMLPVTNQQVMEWRRYGCGGLPAVDGGDLCRTRHRTEVDGGTVSVANTVGLTLAILITLLLVAALLVPEKF